MELKQQTVKAKTRQLQARWTIEPMQDVVVKHMPWPTQEMHAPKEPSGPYKSIIESIVREVIYRYKLRKFNKGFRNVETEIIEAMAVEIDKEIDKEILKSLQVPNELLGKDK